MKNTINEIKKKTLNEIDSNLGITKKKRKKMRKWRYKKQVFKITDYNLPIIHVIKMPRVEKGTEINMKK